MVDFFLCNQSKLFARLRVDARNIELVTLLLLRESHSIAQSKINAKLAKVSIYIANPCVTSLRLHPQRVLFPQFFGRLRRPVFIDSQLFLRCKDIRIITDKFKHYRTCTIFPRFIGIQTSIVMAAAIRDNNSIVSVIAFIEIGRNPLCYE